MSSHTMDFFSEWNVWPEKTDFCCHNYI